MSITELRKANIDKYGEDGWMIKLKFLITKILKEESGDFGFIMKKLCEEKEMVYSNILKKRVLTVLRNWKELKREKNNSKGRITRYSLE